MREHKRELKKTGGGPHPPSPPQLPGDDVADIPLTPVPGQGPQNILQGIFQTIHPLNYLINNT